MQQIDEMCHPALGNVISGGPGYVREDAFYIDTSDRGFDIETIIRMLLKCHINHLFAGAEGETWRACGYPNVEIKSGTILFRLTIMSLGLEESARVIWYEIPFSLYLSQSTLVNYLEKTFEDIL